MYCNSIAQVVDDIVTMAMWFERGRSFALAGWQPRNTLPPPADKWYSNSAGSFREAWDAGWKKGEEEAEEEEEV